MKNKFFVGCNSESAEHIYFSLEEAKEKEHQYIAIFDPEGNLEYELKFTRDGSYTRDF